MSKRRGKLALMTPEQVSTTEGRVLWFEQNPIVQKTFVRGYSGFRPVVGGMPSGSGFVAGIGFFNGLDRERFQVEANARWSTRGYTTLDAELTFPTWRQRLPYEAHVRTEYRDLTSLRFFGLGSGSDVDDRSFYAQEDANVAVGITVTPHRLIEFGGETKFLSVDIGASSVAPSLDERFDPATTPGFDPPEEFLVYGGHVALPLLDQEFPAVGLVLRVDAERYDGRETNVFDFTRVAGEVQLHVPLGYRNRRLAFRFRTSHSIADIDNEVPFYLMETLGGSQTIRGFQEFRFRDRRNVLVNAEYRWEVWNYMDFAFFLDAGKVFSARNDFDLKGLQTGYGFGVRIHTPGGMSFRTDLARSREGVILHFGGGPSF